MFVKLSAVLLF